MMRSLYAGISGLRNHQTRMDVIGNNIANVNTVGFKSSRVTFQDMLSQTIQGAAGAAGGKGGTNPMQIGLGMGLASIDTVFTDGSFQPTGKQTDLAIGGQGFFVLSDGLNQVYTRAGAFDFDTVGNFLVPGTGYKVMGWKADSAGKIDPAQPIAGIQIPVGGGMPAQVSSKVTYANNLSGSAKAIGDVTTSAASSALSATAADDAVTAATTATLPAGATLTAINNAKAKADLAKTAADAAAAPATTSAATIAAAITAAKTAADAAKVAADLTAADTDPTVTLALKTAVNAAKTAADAASLAAAAVVDKSSDIQTSINVYDSQGNAYKMSGTFEKTGDNKWSFTPASTIADKTGAIVANVTVQPAATPIVIDFTSTGTFKQSTAGIKINIDPTGVIPASPFAGAGAFSLDPDFSTMTQFGGDSTAQATAQDGYAAGTLSKVTIDPTGTIVGRFTNGQSLNLAQLALAVFNNPAGLNKAGENLFVQSTNSGTAQIGQSDTGGRGKFSPGSLEMSNVDLASEFSNMIVTQRGFQANSKIITTTDTMLEELVNLKR